LEQLHGYTPAAYATYQGLYSGSTTTLGDGEGGVGGGRDEAVSQDQQQQEEEEDQEGSPAGTKAPRPQQAALPSPTSHSPASSRAAQQWRTTRPVLQLPLLPGVALGGPGGCCHLASLVCH
jgi:hypothetical protein